MSWFTDATKVTHTVTTRQSNLIYQALDKLAAGYDDGPTRRELDELLAQVGDDNRLAHFAAQDARESEQRGHRAIEHISATPMGEELADLLDQNVRDRRAA